MPRWEYAILDCKMTDRWRPWKLNGSEIDGWKRLTVMDAIAHLGNEQWEMVGFSHNPDDEFWVFKRPVNE